MPRTSIRPAIAAFWAVVVLSLASACGAPAIRATLTAPPPTLTPAPSPTSQAAGPGDPARGAKLFTKFQPAAGLACANCHRTDSDAPLAGPGLLHVAVRAASNQDGRLTHRAIDPAAPDRVDQYLRAAISNPSGYVLPGFVDIMPKTWAKVLTSNQIDDLIAYLKSLSRAAP